MARTGTLSRRALLLGAGAAGGYVAGRAWAPGLSQLDGVDRIGSSPEGLFLNDASELMATPIHIHQRPAAHGDALIEAFRAELAAAQSENRPVCVSAARHSMGGQPGRIPAASCHSRNALECSVRQTQRRRGDSGRRGRSRDPSTRSCR